MRPATRAKTLFGILALAAGARFVDFALVGAGLAAAAGSVVFAGAMLMRGDHPPGVNGLQYLAIFARPSSTARTPVEPPPARTFDFAGAAIDPTSVGSIAAAAPADAGIDPAPVGAIDARAAAGGTKFSLVAAEFGFAWVREGTRIFSVRPGDLVPRLGRVGAIVRRDGRWILVGEAGAVLLSSVDPDPATDARAPFGRQMIFGPGK